MVIKKFSYPWHILSVEELKEIINFLLNVYVLDKDDCYLHFVEALSQLIKRVDQDADLTGIHDFVERHRKY
jgi:hypothetical protein